ncbi:hypothetical protein HYU95_01535 [Candidatus Daviesbacteria bacterium]|nr:hypothetical protein [Candidatus Daviesbacteria bacterium]
MEYFKEKYKTIILVILLLGGLLAGVYLVQNQQIFKSKASSEINNVINVTSEGGRVEYQGNKTFKTNSKRINIGIKDLQQIKELE